MAHVIESPTSVCGLFKIKGENLTDVLKFVMSWKNQDKKFGYFEYLFVRICSRAKDGSAVIAIEFLYDLVCEPEQAEHENKKFFHRYTDILKRQFGNGLIAWDVSSPVYIIMDGDPTI